MITTTGWSLAQRISYQMRVVFVGNYYYYHRKYRSRMFNVNSIKKPCMFPYKSTCYVTIGGCKTISLQQFVEVILFKKSHLILNVTIVLKYTLYCATINSMDKTAICWLTLSAKRFCLLLLLKSASWNSSFRLRSKKIRSCQ